MAWLSRRNNHFTGSGLASIQDRRERPRVCALGHVAQIKESIYAGKIWWRRWELNPRPKMLLVKSLHT